MMDDSEGAGAKRKSKMSIKDIGASSHNLTLADVSMASESAINARLSGGVQQN
jgi:hypothetical protein